MIDIGANLTHGSFQDDLDAVIERARAADVTRVVVTGTDLATSRAATELVGRHPGYLVSTAGVHPHDAKAVPTDWLDRLSELLDRPGVVAVGEAGLDFNRNYSPPARQRAVFDAQVELAVSRRRPLFVHDRQSGGAVLEHLRAHRPDPERVVIHCFTGTAGELDHYLSAGYLIGITGWICDERRGLTLRELVARIPDRQLMIETDAPFLQPRTIVPKPKSGRNEPAHLVWVARAVAQARDQSVADVARITRDNARRFFGI